MFQLKFVLRGKRFGRDKRHRLVLQLEVFIYCFPSNFYSNEPQKFLCVTESKQCEFPRKIQASGNVRRFWKSKKRTAQISNSFMWVPGCYRVRKRITHALLLRYLEISRKLIHHYNHYYYRKDWLWDSMALLYIH